MIDRILHRHGSGNNSGWDAVPCGGALPSERKSERGVVLLMVLILSAVGLAIMAALLYLVLAGTQTSGMQKRYRTALEAGVAGSDVLIQVMSVRGDLTSFNSGPINLNAVSAVSGTACLGTSLYTGQSYSGLAAKLMTSTTASGGWSAGCNSALKTDSSSYDLTFSIGTAPNPVYKVYAKIADAVEGNTSGSTSNSGGNYLVTTGVAYGGAGGGSGGEVTVRAIPYQYTVEMDVENASSAVKERAKLQVLYQY
jgi:hypothetical protein